MNTLDACKQYIQSKGCTLWRDWDVSTPDGLERAAGALRDDVDGVVKIRTDSLMAQERATLRSMNDDWLRQQHQAQPLVPIEMKQDVEPWLLANELVQDRMMEAIVRDVRRGRLQ
jgi:hypothetical protein